ncbi:MAG: NAD-dependent epimerase/dehydratase family protein [Dehalococcoidia bacterium]|nr:NAD-dependent epimerase/dehydratase family protein [Dehalococcoidia bacterium]
MAKLVTGGTGFIGACLVDQLLERGDEVVVLDRAQTNHWDGASRKPKIVIGDITNWPEVMNVFHDNSIDCVYHLAAMLSLPSEANPWAAFQVNVVGTMNMLEAVRLFGPNKIIMASTTGTYGLDIDAPEITDTTLQRPTTMYGSTKVFAELQGRFYRKKFGTDFRSVRIPSLVGPGIKTRAIGQYNSWMIEAAALGRPYVCYGLPDRGLPLIYYKDTAAAFAALSDADMDRIKTINYNIAGVNVSATPRDIEAAVKRLIPDAVISYDPDPVVVQYFATLRFDALNDDPARAEWDWQPKFGTVDAIVEDFAKEVRAHPERYPL